MGAANGEIPPGFRNPEQLDYRLSAEAVPAYRGVRHDLVRLVRHDFHGLLRFPEDGVISGAFRPVTDSTLEVEFANGTVQRR